jgi:GT2 family glycosyltransferase
MAATQMLKTAIIVLSYNSLDDTTKPCVESVLRAATGVPFCLVVVDNASTDGSREYLRPIAEQRKETNVILNETNLGYAAGNNVGIRSVEAEYYVLLNSDTVVTDHWLDGLIGFLDAHPEVGIAGPVSNSVVNEQMIHVDSSDEAGILREGLDWAARCRGDFFYTTMLGFFCVVIRREVISKVGLLDEGFGIGTYEDDDFCLRAIQHGYKLACVEDVFIYHKGSVSINNSVPDLNRILRRNRRRFQQKHGVLWRAHFVPASFLDLIEAYLASHPSDPEKLVFKVGNKLKVLRRFKYSAPASLRQLLKRKFAAVCGAVFGSSGAPPAASC